MKLRSFIGFLFGLAAIAALSMPMNANAQKPDILEVVEIFGEIHSGTASEIAQKVDAINDNPKIKAVLLVVDTPGGSVTASSAIYEDLGRLKVPVVVWCQSMCASGGVYVAMAPSVKHIAVRAETIGGSVGVVMHMMRFNRLLEWAKMDPKTYRSGHLKDAGNPTRPAEDAEDKYLQAIVSDLAEKFYGIVAKSRGAKIKNWDEVKTAKIFIGADAVRVGLADTVSSKTEVIAKAKELSGSKTIFTREELRKMTAGSHGDASYAAPKPAYEVLMADAHYLVDTLREVLGGQSVKFSYKLQHQF